MSDEENILENENEEFNPKTIKNKNKVECCFDEKNGILHHEMFLNSRKYHGLNVMYDHRFQRTIHMILKIDGVLIVKD